MKYEAYSESKYRLRIFPPQRWGRDLAHARCLLSFTGKPQTPMREKQMVFMYCSVRLKCSRWSSAPPTVKYGLLSVFEARNVKPSDINRQICEVYGENAKSDGMVREWVTKSNEGRDNVQ